MQHWQEMSVRSSSPYKTRSNSLFITVEKRSCQGRLDVLDSLCRELVAGLELFGGLVYV
jgi:hypothetical protein